MLRIKAKQTNEHKVKGYRSNTVFISRIKGLCFPICFPVCFQRYVVAGNTKSSNEQKLKAKHTNEVKLKVRKFNTQKLKAKQSNE